MAGETIYRYVTFAMVLDPEHDEPEDWRERVGSGEADITSDTSGP